MLNVIKLNRYVFEKGVIQHNVIVNAATLFGDENKLIEARLMCLITLVESLFPASITINVLEPGSRVLTANYSIPQDVFVKAAEQYGTPLWIYDRATIEKCVNLRNYVFQLGKI